MSNPLGAVALARVAEVTSDYDAEITITFEDHSELRLRAESLAQAGRVKILADMHALYVAERAPIELPLSSAQRARREAEAAATAAGGGFEDGGGEAVAPGDGLDGTGVGAASAGAGAGFG